MVGDPDTSKMATILLVEDDLLVRDPIREYLRDIGYEVLEAVDVEAALILLQSRQVEVVFADVRLPGGRSGFDLAKIVSARWPEVPVLLASGYYEPESQVYQVYTGTTLLKKPYRQADVGQHIRSLLRRADPWVRSVQELEHRRLRS